MTITFGSLTPSRTSKSLSVLPGAVDVEDANVPLLAWPAAGHGELAVRQERHRVGPLGTRVDALEQFAGRGFPDGQLVVPADDEMLAVQA